MMHRRYVALLVTATAIAALFAACTSLDDADVAAGITEIEVRDNSFSPRVTEVAPGTEITWTWVGDRDHNVVGDGWASEVIDEGTFTHQFDQPGTYDYVCTLHGGMDGRVLVTEGDAS